MSRSLNINLNFSVFITFIGASYWKVISRKVFLAHAGDLENFQQNWRRKRSSSPCPVLSETLSEIKNERFYLSDRLQLDCWMRHKKASPALFVKFVHQNHSWSAAVLAPLLWVASRALTFGTIVVKLHWQKYAQNVDTREVLQTPFTSKSLSPFLQESDKFVNDETEHDGSLDATIPNWQN